MFRVNINVGGVFGDTFYFDNLPARKDILKALRENMKIAPEYSDDYKRAIEGAKKYNWPKTWTSGLAQSGGPVMFAEYETIKDYQNDPRKVYVDVSRLVVRSVV